MTTISLNGTDWQFKDFYGEDWRWRNAHMPDTRDARGWRQGTVPGSVTNDLWQLREIPDPYVGMNSLALEWVPQRTWLYRKTFLVDDALAGQRVQLCFEGVDYEAEFFLNGESLGTHTGMFTPAGFDVTERLHYGGQNHLVVVIEAAPHEEPQVGRTSRVRTNKARMNYWWDFSPRFVHQGIWDAVYLHVTGPAGLADVHVQPELAAGLDRATVHVTVEVDTATAGAYAITADICPSDAMIDGGDTPAAADLHDRQTQTFRLDAGRGIVSFTFEIAEPRLWWPNGYGEQSLYECTVTARNTDEANTLSDTRRVTFGIRRVEMWPNDTPDASARPYALAVNGRKVYIKGWNWVPMDVLYGVPRPDKLNRLLRLVQEAHANLLRVWGGGLIQTEAFYDLCDRLGILVWQEFIQSSSGIDNVPSEDPAFIEMMTRDAEQIIPRRRNHPSLAVWCGGNELHRNPGQVPLDTEDAPVLVALKAAVERLDPGRAWLPTSPSGPLFGNSLENIEATPDALHDVHGPWQYQGLTDQYTLYNRTTSLLHSEFGVEGLTNRRTLDAVVPAEQQEPVTLDNPIYRHLAAWWIRRDVWDQIFGPLARVDDFVRATQFTQAEGLRYAIEANRRRKWRNSGSLPWQFNEPYPMAACTSAVDYYAHPKPAYHTIKRAYAPVTVTAAYPTLAWRGRGDFEAVAWANLSGVEDVEATLTARLVGFGGTVYGEQTTRQMLHGNAATRLSDLRWPLASLNEPGCFLDLALANAAGTVIAANRYTFSLGEDLRALFRLPATRLIVEQDATEECSLLTIRNEGNSAALNVWLEDARPITETGCAYFDDNYFPLLPGESRRVTATWVGVPPPDREVSVSAWNASVEMRA